MFDQVLSWCDVNPLKWSSFRNDSIINNKYYHIPVILSNLPGIDTYKHQQELFSAVVSKLIRQYLLRDNILAVLTKPIAEKQNKEQVKLEDEFSRQFPLRILIAGYNLINQKIAMKILTKLGYQPKIAIMEEKQWICAARNHTILYSWMCKCQKCMDWMPQK
ncbi:MAG: hypothetical protein ABIU11_03930 [Chitinophagaceae bacterium]